MRRTFVLLVLAGVVAAAGCAGSTGSGNNERRYLSSVRAGADEALQALSDDELLELGNQVCGMMNESGVSAYKDWFEMTSEEHEGNIVVGDVIMPARKWHASIVGSAVTGLCPEQPYWTLPPTTNPSG